MVRSIVNNLSTFTACANTAASCSASFASSAAVNSGNGSCKVRSDEKQQPGRENTNHIVDGKYPGSPLQLAAPPIFVTAVDDLDDVTLFKREFSWFSGFKGIQSLDTSDYGSRRKCCRGD